MVAGPARCGRNSSLCDGTGKTEISRASFMGNSFAQRAGLKPSPGDLENVRAFFKACCSNCLPSRATCSRSQALRRRSLFCGHVCTSRHATVTHLRARRVAAPQVHDGCSGVAEESCLTPGVAQNGHALCMQRKSCLLRAYRSLSAPCRQSPSDVSYSRSGIKSFCFPGGWVESVIRSAVGTADTEVSPSLKLRKIRDPAEDRVLPTPCGPVRRSVHFPCGLHGP